MEKIETTTTNTANVNTALSKKPQSEKETKRSMLLTRRRKVAILAGLFVLLIVTGYFNLQLNNRAPEVGAGGPGAGQTNLFNMFRETRQNERTANVAILESMIGNASYSAAAQAEAEQALFTLMANKTFENTTEGLLLAQFDDVVVTRTNGNVNVLIRRETNIDRQQAGKVLSILRSVDPDLPLQNVFISVIE